MAFYGERGIGADNINWRALQRLGHERVADVKQAVYKREWNRTVDDNNVIGKALSIQEKIARRQDNVAHAQGRIHTASGPRVYIHGKPR